MSRLSPEYLRSIASIFDKARRLGANNQLIPPSDIEHMVSVALQTLAMLTESHPEVVREAHAKTLLDISTRPRP